MAREPETQTSRTPRTTPSVGPGDVLGKRYELRERLTADGFAQDYRAHDLEQSEEVLLRVVRSGLDSRALTALHHRLGACVGIGGKYLPGVLDVGMDNHRLYLTEPMPLGTSLREILKGRSSRATPFSAHELLPVMARLKAALATLPNAQQHGDIRPERIFIHAHGLTLTGGFLVAEWPDKLRKEARSRCDDSYAPYFAPELEGASADESSDRFSVACIAFEALVGRTPTPNEYAPARLGAVGQAISELRAAEPPARPKSLDALIARLAEEAKLPIPELDPGTFGKRTDGELNGVSTQLTRRVDAETLVVIAGESTKHDFDQDELERHPTEPSRTNPGSLFAPAVGSPRETTQQIHADDILEETTVDPDPHGTQQILADDILYETALDADPQGTQQIFADDILYEAAIEQKPIGADPQGTQQVRTEDILEEVSVETDPQGTQQVRTQDILEETAVDPQGTQEIQTEDIVDAEPLARDKTEPQKSTATPFARQSPASQADEDKDTKPRRAVNAAGVPVASVEPTPTPRRSRPSTMAVPSVVLPVRPQPDVAPAPLAVPSHSEAAPLRFETTHPGAGSIHLQWFEQRRARGRLIIVSAVALAVLILLAGIAISWKKRNEAARDHQLQQRWEQLQLERQGVRPRTL